MAAGILPTAQIPTPEEPSVAQPQEQMLAEQQSASGEKAPGVDIYDISGKEPVLGSVPHAQLQDAILSGKYSLPQGISIPVLSPHGDLGDIPSEQAADAFKSGYKYATPQDIEQKQYTTPGQQAIAGAEGLAKGVAGPLATGAERLAGVDPEAMQKRATYNPGLHYGMEALGFAGPALATLGASGAARLGLEGAAGVLDAVGSANMATQVGVAEKAGEALAKGLGMAEEGGVAATAARAAVRGATEMAILQSGDEVSKMLMNDPETSVGHAIGSVGLALALGGAASGVLGSVSPLWKAKFGPKVSELATDFAKTLKDNLDSATPVERMTNELQNLNDVLIGPDGAFSETYGAKGLKAESVEKLLPEMTTPAMIEHAENVVTKAEKTIESLGDDPLARNISRPLEQFKAKMNPGIDPITMQPTRQITPLEIFNATEQFKKQMQDIGEYSPKITPLAQRDVSLAAKSLGYDLRQSLEDPQLWGKAGSVQADINGAATKWFDYTKQFRTLFFSKVGDVYKVDPGKVERYLNGLGKSKAEIKQDLVKEFLSKTDEFSNALNRSYTAVGETSPLENVPMTFTRGTLEKQTVGTKLANALIKHGIQAGAGGVLGEMAAEEAGFHGVGSRIIGIGVGAALGTHLIKPFLNSVLPALIRPLLEKGASAEGLKAAAEYGASVAQGEALAAKAAKNIFRAGAKVATGDVPTEGARNKLDRAVTEAANHPDRLFDKLNSSQIGYYSPAHAASMGYAVSSAVKYLNSIKPNNIQQNPLDKKMPLTSMQQSMYNQALDIAENPLIVLNKVKQGSLTPQEVTHLQAMYPALYKNLQQKVSSEMMKSAAKGEIIAYPVRLSTALFLGMPLDATMTPAGILGAQPSPQPMASSAPKRSTQPLTKLPSMYQTKSQSMEQKRQSE